MDRNASSHATKSSVSSSSSRDGRQEKRAYDSDVVALNNELKKRDDLIAEQDFIIRQLKEELMISKNAYDDLNTNFAYTVDELSKSEATCLNCMMMPMRVGAEVVKQAKQHVQSANKINFTILKNYTHKDFLRQQIEVGGPETELLQLLSNIFDAISAAKVVNKKEVSFEEIALYETKLAKAKAAIFATLMAFANPEFTWDYATIEAVLVKSMTPSRLVLDIVSNIVPGQTSGKSLERHLETFAKSGLEHQNAGLYQGSYVIYVYDNAPTKGGYVFKPSAEEITKSKNQPVYAACMAAHIIEGNGADNLQKDRRLSPKFDKPLLDNHGNLHPNCPRNLHIPHEENVDENEGCESEAQSLVSERDSYYFSRIQNAIKHTQRHVFQRVASVENNDTTNANPEQPKCDYDQNDYTQCRYCSQCYYNRKQICDGAVGCGKPGPLLKFKLGKLVVPDQAVRTDYGGRTMPSRPPLCATKTFSRKHRDDSYPPALPHSSIEPSPPLPDLTSTTGSATSVQASVSDFNTKSYFDNKRKYSERDANDCSIILEALYPKHYNPSGHANISKIFDLLGEEASVEGFIPNALYPWREFTCDLGAVYLNLIDSNRDTSKYGNLRYRHPVGHEYFLVNHVVMKVLWEMGFDSFAKCYGFTSPKQIAFLMLGTLSHKTYDFISICREVLTDCMVDAWIADGGDVNDTDPEERFKEWMHDDLARSDKHFSNIVLLLDNVFPAYSTYTKGIRNNKQAEYNGGQKTLLPFWGLLGKFPYFKGAIRDIWEMEYRVQDIYRIYRKKHFTFGVDEGACQGLCLLMGEQVAALAAVGVRKSESDPLVATLMVETVPDLMKTYNEQAGKKPRRPLNEPRTPQEYAATKILCKRLFDEKVLLNKVLDRTTMYTINKEHKLWCGNDIQSLFSNGVNSIQAYVDSKFDILPTRVKFRTDNKQEEIEALSENEQDILMEGVAEEAETVLIQILHEQPSINEMEI